MMAASAGHSFLSDRAAGRVLCQAGIVHLQQIEISSLHTPDGAQTAQTELLDPGRCRGDRCSAGSKAEALDAVCWLLTAWYLGLDSAQPRCNLQSAL